MKKIIPVALAILLLLCTAVGCSAKAAPHESAMYYNGAAEYETAADAYYEAPAAAEQKTAYGYSNDAAPALNPSQALANRKIIRNADMNVETLTFDAFLDDLSGAISGFGGYIESSSIGNRGYQRNGQQLRYAHYTIRVSADQLDDFLSAVSNLGNVTSVNTSLRDVTTNYVDSEKHLESLRIEQQALMEILAKAETVEDIITVQDRLTHVRYEIESYEAILRTYDDQIALSTVSLNINEVVKETPVEKETFGQEVSRRFKESLESVGEFFRDLGAWLFGSAPEIIVVLAFFGLQALIIVLIVKGAKRSARKRREKAQNAQNGTPKQ